MQFNTETVPPRYRALYFCWTRYAPIFTKNSNCFSFLVKYFTTGAIYVISTLLCIHNFCNSFKFAKKTKKKYQKWLIM